jgi:Na+-driven multidrug efflux pump
MDTALMKYSVQKNGESRKKHITVIILSQLITGLSISLLLYVFREPLAPIILGSTDTNWLSYIAIILFFDSIWNLPMLLLRSEQRPIIYVSLSLLNVFVTMGLNIYFVIYLMKGVQGVFEANIVASGLIFLITLPIIYNRIDLQSFDKKIFKDVLLFALPFYQLVSLPW